MSQDGMTDGSGVPGARDGATDGLPAPPRIGFKAPGLLGYRGGHRGIVAAILVLSLVLVILVGVFVRSDRDHPDARAVAPVPGSQQVAADPEVSSAAAAPGVTGSPVDCPPSPAAALSAADAVTEFFSYINEGCLSAAWAMGGASVLGDYDAFAQGQTGLASDEVVVGSVCSGTVPIALTAYQSDGSVQYFTGTYTVSAGRFTAARVKQVTGPLTGPPDLSCTTS